MSDDSYHKDRIANRKLHPETLMMGFGYSPAMSEGSLKPPIFLTSTFVFENAQQGKDFFDFTSGRRQPKPGEKPGLVYSRFNHPNMEILEDRLAIWDEAEKCAVFASGMAAIATTCFAFLRPGDTIIHSRPLYGGTETLLKNQMGAFGVTAFGFTDGLDIAQMRETAKAAAAKGRVGMILVETPANPTNGLVDLAACKMIADELEALQGHRPPVVVDNTMLGPKYQKPLKQGADLSLLSLTKYVGGHSDLVAGSIAGAKRWMDPVRMLRNTMGGICDPNTAWMLLRSLETVELRMQRAGDNAARVCDYLAKHPKVEGLGYLGMIKDARQQDIYDRHCKGAGSTFSLLLKGGEAECFRFLDSLKIAKLAVSLGGTETLASHPASMTHLSVAEGRRAELGISDNLVRISIGIEDPDDLIADFEQALEAV